MADLVAFLTARYNEDEHYLRTMIEVGERKAAAATGTDLADVLGMAVIVLADPQVLPLLARWVDGKVLPPNDLNRVLREVEAKRAILARYEDCLARLEDDDYPAGTARDQAREYEDFVLPNLAAAYSGHEDYQPAWAA